MDTINHQVANNPDLICTDKPTASEVASDIMNNQVSSYDISDLMDEETQAECFREIVGIYAIRNSMEISLLFDIKHFIELSLVSAAERKGFN